MFVNFAIGQEQDLTERGTRLAALASELVTNGDLTLYKCITFAIQIRGFAPSSARRRNKAAAVMAEVVFFTSRPGIGFERRRWECEANARSQRRRPPGAWKSFRV
ncbi:hypothetical protein EVAR_93442_1 [Eumeta japonica]|uniref:Uncharacterized protein n=1 Tax=Eumeta variegata TaxID=151549 RepID=A0A4C1TJ96_EUMVA|nr:hypothetical protein EVAR_93442_1 [Eumeta japonica]